MSAGSRSRKPAETIFFMFTNNPWCSLAVLFFACSLPALAAGSHEPARLPTFPYAQGWLGADDAYSIPLDANRSIWIFGDTFVGDSAATLRSQQKTMIHNSIGISTCGASGPCTMQYFWRNRQDPAHARGIFDTGVDNQWYWPLDGYRAGNVLYLSLLLVRTRPGSAADDAMGFDVLGTRWAKVANLSAPPLAWKITITPLTDRTLLPGSTVFRDGEFLILYAQVAKEKGNGYMVALRVPLNQLNAPAAHWQYLAKDHTWRAGNPQDDALHVLDQAVSEMSVRYHPALKKWVAITPNPGPLSNAIAARTADTPVGPWSAPQPVYRFPEMTPGNPLYDKDTFCYATKEHIEFGDASLVVTYVCNSFNFQKMLNNMEIYRPQVVVLPLNVAK
jgi:hypothetical protein